MLKIYKFSNINEATNLYSSQSYDTSEAEKAVVAAGVLKQPCLCREIFDYGDGLIVGEVYKTHSLYVKNKLALYSFTDKKVLTPEPISGSFLLKNGVAIVYKRDENNDRLSNLVNSDGIVFDQWFANITSDGTKAGWYPVKFSFDDDSKNTNFINGKGDFFFNEDEMECINEVRCDKDYMIIIDKDGVRTLRAADGKFVMSPVGGLRSINAAFYNQETEKKEHKKFYFVEERIYTNDFTLITDGVSDYDYRYLHPDESDIVLIKSMSEKYNVLKRNDTLLIPSKDKHDQSTWADEINLIDIEFTDKDRNFMLIKRNNKYNLADCQDIKLVFDKWYDKIQPLFLQEFLNETVVCVRDGDDCNIISLDPNSQLYLKPFFPEPVENIKQYKNCPFLFVTKDGQDYVVWKNKRFIAAAVDELEQTALPYAFFIKKDGKFDLIDKYNDTTFCERYMNGEKFDACYDIIGQFPIVEYKGKRGYIDLYVFRPALSKDHKHMVWFDDCELAEEEGPYGAMFQVNDNGKTRYLHADGEEYPENGVKQILEKQ